MQADGGKSTDERENERKAGGQELKISISIPYPRGTEVT
jgi:hypothetical protein